MSIELKVTGLNETIDYFSQLPDEIRLELRASFDRLGASFVDYIRSTKLSGNPLAARTGKLRESINYTVKENASEMELDVGSDSPYAAYHEFGFRGSENVRAHTRLGRPVRAFIRQVDYAGRPFLRPAIEEYQQTIFDEIDASVGRAMQK